MSAVATCAGRAFSVFPFEGIREYLQASEFLPHIGEETPFVDLPPVTAELLQREFSSPVWADPCREPLKPSLRCSHLRPALSSPTDCSSAARRTSMSSISMALAACWKTLSAARTFVDAGVLGSTITFKSVVTAAPVAC